MPPLTRTIALTSRPSRMARDSSAPSLGKKGMMPMSCINNINVSNYGFPTVDFKFQNSGDATAFLWQFVIHVLAAEVDRIPELAFQATVEDAVLKVEVT